MTGEADFAIAMFPQQIPQASVAEGVPSYMYYKPIKWAVRSFYNAYWMEYFHTNLLYSLSRHPIPIKTHGNVIRSFSNLTWAFIFTLLAWLGVTFALIYHIYTKYLPDQFLTNRYVHRFDFIIVTFAGLTEPEPLPWFPKFSTGLSSRI